MPFYRSRFIERRFIERPFIERRFIERRFIEWFIRSKIAHTSSTTQR
ncbi:MAG: hypothetical protein PV344_07940 [Anaplasma sp.]|nr:hypothetical protein [Anaplasma sp.]